MLYSTRSPHGGDIYSAPVDLDYSANINPLGTPESVLEAMRQSLDNIACYPDPYCRSLVNAIAAYEEVPADHILCGSGAAELIYSFCAAVKPRSAGELAPTFSEYSLALGLTGCKPHRFMLKKEREFSADDSLLDWIKEIKPEVLFLCNPNNPTGRLMHYGEELLNACEDAGTRLFLDECFLDLTDNGVSMKPFLDRHPSLVILKAFTKSYGMAGIRLGYCLSSDKELLLAMSQSVQPWNISIPAQAAGIAALKEQAFVNNAKEIIRRERPYLQNALRELGFTVIPSDVNFILFHGKPELDKKLLCKRIAIRNCDNYPGLDSGWYRIAVKTHEQNLSLINAIRSCL